MKNSALALAGVFFLLMSLVHFFRLIYPFAIMVNNYNIPQEASAVFFVASALVAALMFRARSIPLGL